ncbi:MAG: transcription termination factor NusA [Rickettsiales bacterium]|jgi:N utilization substance protein A|nr:transcription termination factor NusA [Rickettsiales bacterium]
MTDVVKGSRELLLVMEGLANDKGIDVGDIVVAMEEGMKLAARKKYGANLAVDCVIDRKTGDIKLYNVLEVVDDKNHAGVDSKVQITLTDAVARVKSNRAVFQENIEVGKPIRIELPPMDMSRIVVQIAKNEIIRKIKEAEKEKEYNEFINKVGTIVSGVVKKTGQRNIVVEVDGYETLLSKDNIIPGEYFRVGDRLKAFVTDVVRGNDNQMFLSRIDNNFLVELMRQEITEIYDGLIETRGVARDPGSKAKVVVHPRDSIGDVVGICVGPRGCKIQAVSSELRGEKIDVIKWSDDRAELVANLLSPAKVNKVVVNDNLGLIEVVISKDQLNLAIGRGGQNIKLASRIAGGRINILTEEEEKEKRSAEFNNTTALFVNALDVEGVIAQLLIAYGYSTIEELANASVEKLKKIEGFDEDIAAEIKNRAEEYIENPEGFSDSVELNENSGGDGAEDDGKIINIEKTTGNSKDDDETSN